MPPLPCPPEHWATFSALLDEALDLPPAARGAWLAVLPAEQAHLRDALAAVLARSGDGADSAGGPALQAPHLGPEPAAPDGRAGHTVGPYTLVAPLGQGGMGQVWRARRSDGAYAREVALKLPHPHLLAGAVRERFARERDILAALVHPHIAAFYDAGVAADGQPYLALELVEGRPITEAARGRPLAERLALFQQVLSAVAHAHGRLVAHRDIKPANVLVDAAGQAKLLDFGIAKLLDGDAADQKALTRESAPATPRYASPEQRFGGPVTVATDVYALGLMLHELLTGQPAWPDGLPPVASSDELPDPPPPSRRTDDPALRRALAGDLDAIVLKALQADPPARYASVAAFADDLQRQADGRPIAARRLAPLARALKFVRRHRLPVALAGALALSLVAGVAAVVWQSRAALEQARRAEAVKGFLVSVFEGADPRLPGNRPRGMTPVRELLDREAGRIDTAFAADPMLRLELQRLVAELYGELGEPEAAQRWRTAFETLAARQLPPLHAWRLGARVEGLLRAYNEGDQARCRALAGPLGEDIARAGLADDPLHGMYLTHLALCHTDQPAREADRLQWLHQADALFTRAAPGSRGHVTVWMEIANIHTPAGRQEESLAANRRALAMAEALPRRNEAELQTLHGNVGLTLQQMGRLDESADAYGRAADVAERTVGVGHPTSWDPRVNHLRTLHLAGRRDEAWALLPALEAAIAQEGDRPDTRVNLANLCEHVGERLAAEGRPRDALPWLRRAAQLQAQAAVYPFAHRRALRHLGDALDRDGQHAEAGRVLADALKRYEAADAPGRQPLLAARERWARWLLARGRNDEAQAQFQRVLADAQNKRWAHVALAQAGLARVALVRGDQAAADQASAAALGTWAAVTGFRDVRMQAYLCRVRAAVLERQPAGQAEADALWQQALAAARRTDAPQSPTRMAPRGLPL